MTLVYYNPRVLDHQTGSHPEKPARLEAIAEHFGTHKLWGDDLMGNWTTADAEALHRVHVPDYLESVSQLAERGGGMADADTVVSRDSWEVARLAAGCVVDATRRVVRGEAKQALCLVRPPGHHALSDRAMGFCLVNNVAVGARFACDELHLHRVLIVDWDVHHGNATQDSFYANECVGFFSAHRHPFYPGTGASDETGTGNGLGATRNLPFKMGVSRDRYLAEFARELEAFAARLKPELVMVSAGFDAHRLDPVGSLGLETEDFDSLTRIVQDIAATHASGRIVSVLEGGYNPSILAECVAIHLAVLRELDETKSA